MSKITADEVRRVAKLARLHLSDGEVAMFAVQLGDIVSMIQSLSEVDTESVSPMEHVAELSNALVDDVAVTSLNREAALGNAPSRDDSCFLVPAVMGHGSRSS